ncbi:MAG: retroviral-like aspartic protease family protein [Candidatus Brockarchaeota archaeon]|nr:retroviral-like aspartic protease family protein [Candidatus Brockarchaeota archaeon]
MNYIFEYSSPSLKVRFTRPFSERSLELQAKLDTGADMTVLPQHAVSELRLIPASRVRVSSFDGRGFWRYTYFVNISFNGFENKMVEVINAQRRDALLGRDVLNRLKTVLDGKALSLNLLDP